MTEQHHVEQHRVDASPWSEVTFLLGESPIWDRRRDELVLVDLRGEAAVGFTPDGRVAWRRDFEASVSAITPRDGGGYLVAEDRDLVLYDATWNEQRRVEVLEPHLTFNDGKCDPAGRFWVGSISHPLGAPGALYRVDLDLSVRKVHDGLGLSNGLGWSPDGKTFYLTDSLRRTILRFTFDADGGVIGEQSPPLVMPDRFASMPDGLVIGADGRIWLGAPLDGCLVGLSPDGDHVATLSLPVTEAVAAAFGGPGLDTLFVTTAADLINPALVEALHLDPRLIGRVAGEAGRGHVFVATGLGAGAPVAPFAG